MSSAAPKASAKVWGLPKQTYAGLAHPQFLLLPGIGLMRFFSTMQILQWESPGHQKQNKMCLPEK